MVKNQKANLTTGLLIVVFAALWLPSLQSSFTYNEYDAYQNFYYSKISYCNYSDIVYWTCIDCAVFPYMTNIQAFYNSTHHSQAYTGYDKDANKIVVAFRGTNDIVNWINDAKFEQVAYPHCSGCTIHLGFQETFNDIASGLMQSVKNLKKLYPKATLVVTGHSLGAAVASIAAVEIQLNIGNVDQLINFESPRVGNAQFATYFHNLFPSAYRVVHYHDVVPHVPPNNMGYHHHATEIWYYKESWQDNQYYVCDSSGEDPLCADSVDPIYFSVDDHTQLFNEYTGCDTSESLAISLQQLKLQFLVKKRAFYKQ